MRNDVVSQCLRLLRCILLALVVIVLMMASKAKAQGMAEVMICDTAEQIELFYTGVLNGIPAHEMLQAANTDSPTACGVVPILVDRLDVVKTIQIAGKSYDIVKVHVMGVMTPSGPLPADLEQYAMRPGKDDQDA